MATERQYLDSLAELHLATTDAERRALWRQGMATLAAEAADNRPVPLEGLDPNKVLKGVRIAAAEGLLQELNFLSPEAAATALYELAAVLPMGDERRAIGRQVATFLHQGNASTFVALATQLAVGSRKALSGPAVRARVALSLDLPIGSGTRADSLALALISRRELAQDWLVDPSTGSLPSRRLAARLLERASREAARRAAQGDDSLLAVFKRPLVRASWQRLLMDRESLVWRHVATARGLLSRDVSRLAHEITEDLAHDLSPTEWRRAAASLAASIAVDPKQGLERCLSLLGSLVFEQDRGIAAAMLLGLPRAAEVEPEAAEELSQALVREGGVEVAEALLSLRYEQVEGDFGAWACQRARATLREQALSESPDDGMAALAQALDQDLRPDDERTQAPTLRSRLQGALSAFAQEGAQAAHTHALAILQEVEHTLARLEASPSTTSEGRRQAFLALRELDSALLETSALHDLLMLGSKVESAKSAATVGLDFHRLTHWLLRHERAPVKRGEPINHPTLRISRLRTLLHTVDADGSYEGAQAEDLRDRRLSTVRILLERVRDDAPCMLRRVLTAAAARACDAVLREEIGELSDIYLTVVRHVETKEGLQTMAEASMVPEMKTLFAAHANLVEQSQPSVKVSSARARESLAALRILLRALPVATSPRVDALHGALLALNVSIARVMGARSLAELAGEAGFEGSLIAQLEGSVRLLARLVMGAERRLGERPPDAQGIAGPALRVVDIAIERAYRGDPEALGEALATALGALHDDLPTHLAEVTGMALVRSLRLPLDPSAEHTALDSFRPDAPAESPLPRWLPPSRTIGGFYVTRTLGKGAAGSVLVAKRSDEKTNDLAPLFALKVPEYSGAAARTLSEQEFLRMFREEAGALLAIPEHENLARLVTFDAGARPKPILVMELIEGTTLERSIDTYALDMERSLALIDGVASGLSAMHSVGVGHLDIKPSNVILRDSTETEGADRPVLVDFGLAGRHIRPGCATANYGAPEVWGLLPKGYQPTAADADAYAFGCLVYEILTGEELVGGPTEIAIISAHLAHDGDFPGLLTLAKDPDLRTLADLLRGSLRQDPRSRTGVADLRAGLRELSPIISAYPWPLMNAVAL